MGNREAVLKETDGTMRLAPIYGLGLHFWTPSTVRTTRFVLQSRRCEHGENFNLAEVRAASPASLTHRNRRHPLERIRVDDGHRAIPELIGSLSSRLYWPNE